jgi:uroporphyrinogen III methyltransferase/synthase
LWKRLKNRFEKIGMKPISVCNMKVVPTEYMKELENELHNLNVYQWILFTSQNAVQLFFEKINQEDIDIRNLGRLKFAVLGSGTAEKLRSYGIKADFLPSRYTVSVMSEEFAKIIKNGERVLVPRAVQGSRDLDNILDKYNIDYKDIPIYDVSGRMTQKIKYLEDLDYLVFVSASGVTAFFEELRKERLSLPKGIKLACIGNITRQRLLQEYGEADVVATVNDVNGLIDAIKIQR